MSIENPSPSLPPSLDTNFMNTIRIEETAAGRGRGEREEASDDDGDDELDPAMQAGRSFPGRIEGNLQWACSVCTYIQCFIYKLHARLKKKGNGKNQVVYLGVWEAGARKKTHFKEFVEHLFKFSPLAKLQ